MAQPKLLSTHGRALVFLARTPKARLRDVADGLDVTERTAHRIVSDLVEAGYVLRERKGSRNEYEVRSDIAIHDPLLAGLDVGEILPLKAA
jgi:DNA-binding MarR family transcriptional regulator